MLTDKILPRSAYMQSLSCMSCMKTSLHVQLSLSTNTFNLLVTVSCYNTLRLKVPILTVICLLNLDNYIIFHTFSGKWSSLSIEIVNQYDSYSMPLRRL